MAPFGLLLWGSLFIDYVPKPSSLHISDQTSFFHVNLASSLLEGLSRLSGLRRGCCKAQQVVSSLFSLHSMPQTRSIAWTGARWLQQSRPLLPLFGELANGHMAALPTSFVAKLSSNPPKVFDKGILSVLYSFLSLSDPLSTSSASPLGLQPRLSLISTTSTSSLETPRSSARPYSFWPTKNTLSSSMNQNANR